MYDLNLDEEWKKLHFYTDFYKYNWQLVKSLAFIVLSLSGTVSAFCLTQQKSDIAPYALLIPIVMNLFLLFLMANSLKPIKHNSKKVTEYAESVGMEDAPELKALTYFMCLTIFITAVVTFGLVILFCHLK